MNRKGVSIQVNDVIMAGLAAILSVPMSLPVKLPGVEPPNPFYSLYFYECYMHTGNHSAKSAQ
jgi:hypothetical protein